MSALFVTSQLVFSLICVASLIGNSLVLYVIWTYLRSRSKHSSITIRCMTQLAVADLISCVMLPFLISSLTPIGWPFSSLACRSFLSLTALPQFLKAFMISVLGVICYALHEGSAFGITDKIVSMMISGAWAMSLLIAIPVALYADVSSGSRCNIYWHENVSASDAFVLIYAFCVFVLPLAVVFALGRKRNEPPFPGSDDVSLVRNSIRIVFVLVSVHLVLLFPYLVGQLVLNYFKTAPGYLPKWKVNFSLLSAWIWNSACAVFPFLYYNLSDDLREGMQHTLQSVGKLRIHYSTIATKPFLKSSQDV